MACMDYPFDPHHLIHQGVSLMNTVTAQAFDTVSTLALVHLILRDEDYPSQGISNRELRELREAIAERVEQDPAVLA